MKIYFADKNADPEASDPLDGMEIIAGDLAGGEGLIVKVQEYGEINYTALNRNDAIDLRDFLNEFLGEAK